VDLKYTTTAAVNSREEQFPGAFQPHCWLATGRWGTGDHEDFVHSKQRSAQWVQSGSLRLPVPCVAIAQESNCQRDIEKSLGTVTISEKL